jgi:hypothetical protein
MGIVTDIVGIVSDAVEGGRAVAGLIARGATGMDTSHPDGGRFFQREMDSVARKARKSILLFPVIVTEGINPVTASTLARMLQIRSAEYVRLAITNMDHSVAAPGSEKSSAIAQLRGASLGDAAFGEAQDAVNALLLRDALLIAEQAAAPPPRLGPPMEPHFLAESGYREGEDGGEDFSTPEERGGSIPDEEGYNPDTVVNIIRTDEQFRAAAAEWKRQEEARWDAENPAGGENPSTHPSTHPSAHPGGPATAAPSTALTAVPPGGKLAIAGAASKDSGLAKWASPDKFDDVVNRFLPVMLDLTFKYTTVDSKSGHISDPQTARILLGVKSVVHQVPSHDLVDALGKSMQRDSMFLQFLKLTSGEISLVSDFLLNLDVAKDRVAPATTAGKKVLEQLRKQAEWNRSRSQWLTAMLTKRGFVPPTSTVVVTSEEAAQIRARHNVDFTKPAVVRKLLSSHNLMAFAIVDEALGLVRLFEDGDDDFDRIPFSEMQSRSKEPSVKEIMQIVSRR